MEMHPQKMRKWRKRTIFMMNWKRYENIPKQARLIVVGDFNAKIGKEKYINSVAEIHNT